MKVFISSVRRGLEEERDALPGLILALGHQPLRFEDFTAGPVPSREACLRGVGEADVYLLLLGGPYGEPLPDTGRAPTEEEWTLARELDLPVLVFRKRGEEPEPRQREFIAEVEAYATGKHRKAFDRVGDLLPLVVQALNHVSSQPPALVWSPLPSTVQVPWDAGSDQRWGFSQRTTSIELHAVPVGGSELRATELTALPDSLARALRDSALVSHEQALETGASADSASVRTRPDGRDRHAGLAVQRGGSVSVWQELERDALGAILDPEQTAQTLSSWLRLLHRLGVLRSADTALALQLTDPSMVVIGSRSDLGRRSSASLGLSSGSSIRVEARDSIPTAALDHGATEVAKELSTRLLLALQRR